MITVGEETFEWILMEVKGWGKVVGLVPVPQGIITDNAKVGSVGYKKAFANRILGGDQRTIEVARPHQIGMSPERGIAVVPFNYGDMKLFIRCDEVAVIQFMDESCKIVKSIMETDSKIIKPGNGLAVPRG